MNQLDTATAGDGLARAWTRYLDDRLGAGRADDRGSA